MMSQGQPALYSHLQDTLPQNKTKQKPPSQIATTNPQTMANHSSAFSALGEAEQADHEFEVNLAYKGPASTKGWAYEMAR